MLVLSTWKMVGICSLGVNFSVHSNAAKLVTSLMTSENASLDCELIYAGLPLPQLDTFISSFHGGVGRIFRKQDQFNSFQFRLYWRRGNWVRKRCQSVKAFIPFPTHTYHN